MSEKRVPYNIQSPDTDVRTHLEEPPLYHVVLLNDDYTSMEFVVLVLQKVFHQSPSQAASIMMEVHSKGRGVAGTFIKDIAKTKADTVMHMAFERNYPLKCLLEEA